MNRDIMFSHANEDWETPQEIFDSLNSLYHFTLDAAAADDNYKCEKHYTATDSGLNHSWGGETVWLNPPYGRQLKQWVRKAWEESQKPGTKVVLLLPARTDTKWFHDYCMKGICIFIKGRLYFGRNGWTGRAPFPSLICIFE